MMHKVALLQEFQEGNIIPRVVKGKQVALVKIKDQIFAFDDECTHEQYPLHEGIIEGEKIECVHHGTQYDLRTGKVLALPATHPLKVYRTEIKLEEVWVDI